MGGRRTDEEDRAGVPSGGGAGGSSYDSFAGYDGRLFGDTPYDDEDEEADLIYGAIEDRMGDRRRGRKRDGRDGEEEDGDGGPAASKGIGDSFRDLKERLATVTEREWAALPDVGDHGLKLKQRRRRQEVFTPLPDSVMDTHVAHATDATSGRKVAPTTGVKTPMAASSTGIVGLAEARGTVLGMSLDRVSQDSVSGQTNVDPKGYLTSLDSSVITSSADLADINKARLLLKSVRDTNPKHGPGWIAAARVEECAGKMAQARAIIREGTEVCPDSEDVWLEAARLSPPNISKTVLATAVRHIPKSVKIYLAAADMENTVEKKRAVLRRAIEAIPTSVKLWWTAIELEDEEDAKILLGVAIERVPRCVDMYLALARLETYDNARAVLNKARRALPADPSVWIAAARLEEGQGHHDNVDKVISKALASLAQHGAVLSRQAWLQKAEGAEASGCPRTCAAVVRHAIGMDVDEEDRARTWADDADSSLARGRPETARAALAHALAAFPTNRALWMKAEALERAHGTPESLEEVLAGAVRNVPRAEVLWLMRAKEKMVNGRVAEAREILTQAFAANENSQEVWLAAVKLEWENDEYERARMLLSRARERCPADRVFMKSALLERECQRHEDALRLLEEGVARNDKFSKFYMIAGQICAEDLQDVDRARKFYQRGLQKNPHSLVLWILAARLEERHGGPPKPPPAPSASAAAMPPPAPAGGVTKARSLLELGRLKNPKDPALWLEAVRLERRAGNAKLATSLMSRALQECPTSGVLWAEEIRTAPRAAQKAKSVDAIKRCTEDPHVIAAVAGLFANNDRKYAKARKWFERAAALDPDLGDTWAAYYAFEKKNGTEEQAAEIKRRCVAAEPTHGERWCAVVKEMQHRRKGVAEGLELVVQKGI